MSEPGGPGDRKREASGVRQADASAFGRQIVQFTSTGAVRSIQVVPASETETARAVAATADGGFDSPR